MAIKSFKPYSAGRRFMTVSAFDEITASKPEKSLLAKISQKGGRNNTGKMTVRQPFPPNATLSVFKITS